MASKRHLQIASLTTIWMIAASANTAMASRTNAAGREFAGPKTGLTLDGVPRLTDAPLSAIAAPHSGTHAGPTAAPGGLDSRAVTGPGAMSLIGAALIGAGMLRRGRIFRK